MNQLIVSLIERSSPAAINPGRPVVGDAGAATGGVAVVDSIVGGAGGEAAVADGFDSLLNRELHEPGASEQRCPEGAGPVRERKTIEPAEYSQMTSLVASLLGLAGDVRAAGIELPDKLDASNPARVAHLAMTIFRSAETAATPGPADESSALAAGPVEAAAVPESPTQSPAESLVESPAQMPARVLAGLPAVAEPASSQANETNDKTVGDTDRPTARPNAERPSGTFEAVSQETASSGNGATFGTEQSAVVGRPAPGMQLTPPADSPAEQAQVSEPVQRVRAIGPGMPAEAATAAEHQDVDERSFTPLGRVAIRPEYVAQSLPDESAEPRASLPAGHGDVVVEVLPRAARAVPRPASSRNEMSWPAEDAPHVLPTESAEADSRRVGPLSAVATMIVPQARTAPAVVAVDEQRWDSRAGESVQMSQSPLGESAAPGDVPGRADFQPLEGATSAVIEAVDFDVETNSVRIARAVASQLHGRANGSLRLQLDPPGLGEIQIDIALAGRSVRVSLLPSTESSARLLGERLEQLRSSLAGRGLSVSSLSVDPPERVGQSSAGQPGQSAQQQAGQHAFDQSGGKQPGRNEDFEQAGEPTAGDLAGPSADGEPGPRATSVRGLDVIG